MFRIMLEELWSVLILSFLGIAAIVFVVLFFTIPFYIRTINRRIRAIVFGLNIIVKKLNMVINTIVDDDAITLIKKRDK